MTGFEVLIGQAPAKARLEAMIGRGRLPHALLFSGVEGTGKLRAAMTLAQIVMCLERKPDEANACDRCPSCIKIKEGVHADVHVLANDERALKIDAIRELMQKLQLKPMEGRAKILIVDRAEKMTLQSQNALLKTLEEPTGSAYIVLTSARPWTILPTVLSRCQRIFFVPLARDEIARILMEEKQLGAAEATLLAGMSQGSLSRAREIEAAELMNMRDRAASLDVLLFPGKRAAVHEALTASADLAEDRPELALLLDTLLVWLHDQAVLASGAEQVGVTNVDRLRELEALAGERGLRMVLERSRAVLYAKRRLDLPFNLNPQMIAEQLCLALAGQVVAPADPEA
jgi:DNA polymerase-3 subunit delta'